MDHKRFGQWAASPFRALIMPVVFLILAISLFLWLGGYMVEKGTGYQTLPEVLAPARKTPKEKIAEDKISCGVENVLVDTKATRGLSQDVVDLIIKTLLNHSFYYNENMCGALYDMSVLVAPGVKRNVVRRNELYMKVEFLFEWKRKEALAQRFRDLEALGYGHEWIAEWTATHYVRPRRERTKGNQTEEEIAGLKAVLNPVTVPPIKRPDGKIEPLNAQGFAFYGPKEPPKP